jgi:hypothetical protein
MSTTTNETDNKYLQFVYIQKKNIPLDDSEYLVIIKNNNKEYNSIELNEIIYSELYNVDITDDLNKNINYIQHMYLKKGMTINNCSNDIWEQFIKIKLENMKLINLIDNKMTNKILTTKILYFNYNKYKKFINSIISNIITKSN